MKKDEQTRRALDFVRRLQHASHAINYIHLLNPEITDELLNEIEGCVAELREYNDRRREGRIR